MVRRLRFTPPYFTRRPTRRVREYVTSRSHAAPLDIVAAPLFQAATSFKIRRLRYDTYAAAYCRQEGMPATYYTDMRFV